MYPCCPKVSSDADADDDSSKNNDYIPAVQMFPVMLMMIVMLAIIVKMYLLSKLIQQIQHVWFMCGVDTDDGDGSNNNDNVPAVQTRTANTACWLHVQR